jgi:hypothetical protein
MPLIPALRRQRQVNLSEFKANLVYRVSSRIQGYTEITAKRQRERERERERERDQLHTKSKLF